jgi:DNA (cytosine-5)-methyltransferase 1
MSVVGNCAPVSHARKIMECPWMTGSELAQAIPPAYTQHIGDALRRHFDREQRRARDIPA